jgi:hypothetical protein
VTYYLILLDGASNCDAHKKKMRAEEGIHDDHFTIGHRAWRRAGHHQGRNKVLTATLVGTTIE